MTPLEKQFQLIYEDLTSVLSISIVFPNFDKTEIHQLRAPSKNTLIENRWVPLKIDRDVLNQVVSKILEESNPLDGRYETSQKLEKAYEYITSEFEKNVQFKTGYSLNENDQAFNYIHKHMKSIWGLIPVSLSEKKEMLLTDEAKASISNILSPVEEKILLEEIQERYISNHPLKSYEKALAPVEPVKSKPPSFRP